MRKSGLGWIGIVKTLKNLAFALYTAPGPWSPAAEVTGPAVLIKVSFVFSKGIFNATNGTAEKLAHW